MRDFLARRTQFLVYITGGVICAAIDIGVMQMLIGARIAYPIATSAGFASGLLVNYAFHAKLTFRTSATTFNFARFICVVGMNYLLTMACVALAVHWLPLQVETASLVGKLASLPLVAMNGFLLGKYWIFK